MNSAPLPPIHLRPAWNSENPFCRMLADALVNEGLRVEEMGFGARAVPDEPAIIFLHWPNEFFFRHGVRLTMRRLRSLAFLWRAKRRHGQKLVWLVHNIEPHDRTGKPFNMGRKAFFGMVDGLVFLSEVSRAMFLERFPHMSTLPYAVIRHGHYRPCAFSAPYLPAPLERRPASLIFAGRVMRYKAPEKLAAAVAAAPAGLARLSIAGACDDSDLAEELSRIAARSDRIDVRLEFLSDEALENIVDSGDAVVMAYRDILNSGSALYALSRARPFIAPRLGGMLDLQQHVGMNWVWLFDGEFTDETLQQAMAWLRERDGSVFPDLSAFDWEPIGQTLAALFREITRAGRVERPSQ